MKYVGSPSGSDDDISTRKYFSAVAQDVVPDVGYDRSMGSYSKPWGWIIADVIRNRVAEFVSSGFVATLGRNAAATADQAFSLPSSPTSDVLVSRESTDSFKNKNLTDSSNTFPAIVAPETHAASAKSTPGDSDEFPLADSGASWGIKRVTGADVKAWIKSYYDSVVATLTNKSISLGSNTVTGTTAQFNAALSDNDFATLTGDEILSGKIVVPKTLAVTTSNGTTTLAATDPHTIVFDGSTDHTLKLPSTGVAKGEPFIIANGATGGNGIAVRTAGNNAIVTIGPGDWMIIIAKVAAPSSATDWMFFLPANWLTGGTMVKRDAAGWGWFKGVIPYRDTIASAGTTTTLTSTSAQNQAVTGTANQTIKLPSSNVYYLMEWCIVNDSTGTVTVQSSNGNTVDTISFGAMKIFKSLKDTPTTSAHWRAI